MRSCNRDDWAGSILGCLVINGVARFNVGAGHPPWTDHAIGTAFQVCLERWQMAKMHGFKRGELSIVGSS